MRPAGVHPRILDLHGRERAWDSSRHEHALRADLAAFLALCCAQAYSDHAIHVTLDKFLDVVGHLDDPSQVRSGTDYETRGLLCIDQLRPLITDAASRRHELSIDEGEDVRKVLVQTSQMTLLGETGPKMAFHLSCWTAACSLVEDAVRPYRAARRALSLTVYEPEDSYGVIEPLTTLVERYEDDPDRRTTTGEEITGFFVDYLTRVPWPLDAA